jgi:hypothetical protein
VGPEPSEIPEVVPIALTCQRCHERNPEGSAFCWRCFMPFPGAPRQVVSAQVGPGGLPSVGASTIRTTAPPPPSFGRLGGGAPLAAPVERVPKWIKVACVVLAVLAVVSGGYVVLLARPTVHVHLPDSIAGAGRLADPTSTRAIQSLEDEAKREGLTVHAGVYGVSGAPTFLMATYEYHRRAEESAEDLFRHFSSGFETGTGASTIDLDSAKTTADAVATFVCARITGDVKAGLCMWQDDVTVGFVVEFDRSIAATRVLASQARVAVEQ